MQILPEIWVTDRNGGKLSVQGIMVVTKNA